MVSFKNLKLCFLFRALLCGVIIENLSLKLSKKIVSMTVAIEVIDTIVLMKSSGGVGLVLFS